MRKWIFISITVLLFGALLSACSQSSQNGADTASVTKASWPALQKQARGQTVNFYMWGGSQNMNQYIDNWVAPRLKKEDGITLHRVPVNDTQDIINQLLSDKQAGKNQDNIDIGWINGENFIQAQQNHLLWGPFVNKLPNYTKYIDGRSPNISYDFGMPTNGYEAPWASTQFAFIYNAKYVKNPPRSMAELAQWAKQHPGKFTYPAPPDFTGSAFLRMALYETSGGYRQYMKPLNTAAAGPKLTPLWHYLNTIKPYLWRQGTTYPSSVSQLDQLYASGEIWMDMDYDPAYASSMIDKGIFPKSTRTFLLSQGTLANTSYLDIPYNAKHKAAAMVAINFMESPDAQLAMFNPKILGTPSVIDLKKLPLNERQKFETMNRGIATLPQRVLDAHRVPEIPSAYVPFLEKAWTDHVAKK
jgi:ABC-type uncharacterized transport system, periplasmic component